MDYDLSRKPAGSAESVEAELLPCVLRRGCDAPNLCRSQQRCCAQDAASDRARKEDAAHPSAAGRAESVPASTPARVGIAREQWRHLKTGNVYTIIAPEVRAEWEYKLLGVVYRGDDGQTWFRPYGEFHDGRFVRVADAAREQPPRAVVCPACHGCGFDNPAIATSPCRLCGGGGQVNETPSGEQPPQHDKAAGDTGGAATDGQTDSEPQR